MSDRTPAPVFFPTPAATPIAIVGLGCRFPGGATDAASFWRLLANGDSAIREVPPERWNLARYYDAAGTAPGTMATRWGGFVDLLEHFDARFWGVTPREAVRMDPQQRWLLEVAWDAIEDAGIAAAALRGRPVGVFVGIAGNDYGGLQLADAENVDAYTNSGSTASIASNRISFMLDLRGPSASVDTACSSALVAVWMACQNIWSGACEAALAGGVNALISPQVTVGFAKASMLSRTGQCYAFDARADGYVRAEGAGLVLLKPLPRAVADGDRIYAVIRGAAVNQDGHTSSMTVPSLDGQAAMLREAYEQAGIAPARVAYVEAHGTGTPVGDPIEAGALGRVIGQGRSAAEACPIGSVKTNIGHLEAASGIAGLIKAALVAHHRHIPASLNWEQPNPQIPFDSLGLRVADRAAPLVSVDDDPPVVGVNSFGFGGTNAHIVLQSVAPVAPAPSAVPDRAERPCVLPISARDETALRASVQRYRELLAETTDGLSDLCAAAGARRDHHSHRVVVIGADPRDMRGRARAWLRDGQAPGVIFGRASAAEDPVFVFTGQGAQWWGMGRRLLAREPVAKRCIEEIDAKLHTWCGWSVIDELCRDEGTSRIDRTDVAQPAIFAVQVALAELWRCWGINPGAVVGHSVGEVAAAHCAGIYTLDDAVAVIFHRSRLQHQTNGQGRMLAAAVSADAARELVSTFSEGIELGAINSPRLVTLTGRVDQLEAADRRLQQEGVFTRWLRIDYAFHSYQMDPLEDELRQVLAGIEPRPSRAPFISTVTGQPLAGELLDAEYWWNNVRRPVMFETAVSSLIRAPHETFLEIGPHPALESSVTECLAEQGRPGGVFHSLRRDADDSQEMLANLAALHARGVPVDWRRVNQGTGTFVALPHYPWNREAYWFESKAVSDKRLAAPVHPLLGFRVSAATPTWRHTLDLRRLPYLADHRIWDRVVFPAAGFGEIGLAVARQLFPEDAHALEDLEIAAPLFVSEDSATRIQVAFNPEDNSVLVHAAVGEGEQWELHATGRLVRSAGASTPLDDHIRRLRASADHFSDEQYRSECARRGYQFGPAFQQVQHLWRGDREALVEITAPPSVAAGLGAYVFHPAVQDACFHAFLGLPQGTPDVRAVDGLFVPRSISRIQLHTPAASTQLFAFGRLVSDAAGSLVADIRVARPDGVPVADILGLRLERVETSRRDDLDECYYRFVWQPRHLRGSNAAGAYGFAPAEEIVEAVKAETPALRQRHALDAYHAGSSLQQGIVCQLVLNAFLELGWRPQPADRIDLEDFLAALGIVDEHRRITRILLRDLEAHGWLRAAGHDAWTVLRLPHRVDGAAALDRVAAESPRSAADITFGRRTGLHLAAVLSGETDAMELLFPNGSAEHVERFYQQGAAFPGHLEAMRIALARGIASLPTHRALRVLEVGGGTGTLTRALLPALPSNRTEYLLTDLSPLFLAAARKRFAEFSFVDYQLFDIEKDPASQGIAEGSFDVIVAADVLHATADLRTTLEHLRRTLASGGLLMFMELVNRDLSLGNITFGLLKGWWRATDLDLRPESPLLDRTAWLRLLADAGFRDVATVSCTEDQQQAEHATFVGFALPAEGVPDDVPPRAASPSRYLLFADEGGVAAALGAQLERLGHECVVVPPGGTPSDAETRRMLVQSELPVGGVIHCGCLDHPRASDLSLGRLHDAQATGLMSAFRLIRTLAEERTPVWFATRHLQRVTPADRVDGLASAPLIGLTRVANNEHQCRFSVIDLDDCSSAEAAHHLLSEATLIPDGELETAYRDGVRYALRFTAVRPDTLEKRTFDATLPGGGIVPYRLQTDRPGILTGLGLHETGRVRPGPGEIEVRVRAGGINFRDVMKALGTYPGNPIDVEWFGDDFAGTVVRVGDGVDAFCEGDAVTGMAPYAFRSYATTDARLAFRKPPTMSFEEAATLPTAFLTAHYALNHLARMQPGERILIHAGTGGVGQAAIQIARRLSLEIFATAGTPEKRQLLTDMGVAYVMSSRTLEFADEILAITGGRGVDAVLNSLAGDFIPKSLSALAPCGRFLEIGKADIYRNAKIGLRSLRNNVSYHVIDLSQHLVEKPALVAQMFRELAERFASGDYRPLPSRSFPISEAVEAFRYMAQGRHVGKNVLTFDTAAVRIGFRTDQGNRFRPDATYLVTGGGGGFGLEVATWIAREGARHLVLLSRSGPRDERASSAIDALRAGGTEVIVARADVARPEDVQRIIDHVCDHMPPLRGVFHAAMVMDDEFVAKQTEERIWRVLGPKMSGAWNLHLATQDHALEHFVCFSSFSTVIAIPKQASYNAGNVFLDQLAQHRRAMGLPALTVNFGALLGAGYVERQQKDGAALARLGFGAFQVDEALRVLQRLLFLDAVQVCAGRVDWELVLRLSPLVASSNTYKSLLKATRDAGQRGSLITRLRAATDEDRSRLVEDFIVSQVAGVFAMAEEKIDRSAALTSLGLDSLMILELTNRVERELGLRIPMASLLSGPTVIELGQAVLRLLGPTLSAPLDVIPPSDGSGPLAATPAHAPAPLADRPRDVGGHVMLLRAGGDAPPLFGIHPAGGGVGIYAGMAAHLPQDSALYGIESRLKRGADQEYPDVEEIVQRYARAVRETYVGPYRLFGFSLGGYLAARVAEALERDDARVQFVGVIDWDPRQKATPAAQREGLTRLAVAAYLFAQQEVGLVRPLPVSQLNAEIAGRVDDILCQRAAGTDVFFRWVVERRLVVDPALEEMTRQHLNRFEQHCRLLTHQLPLPRFVAPLCIWRARDGFGSGLDSWDHLGDMSEEHVLDGDHNALVRPEALRIVARQMIEFLARVSTPEVRVESA